MEAALVLPALEVQREAEHVDEPSVVADAPVEEPAVPASVLRMLEVRQDVEHAVELLVAALGYLPAVVEELAGAIQLAEMPRTCHDDRLVQSVVSPRSGPASKTAASGILVSMLLQSAAALDE